MSTKKCACFTPSGLVYTRLETDGNIARRPVDLHRENVTRTKRSMNNDVFEPNTVDTILEENPSIGHLSFQNEPLNEVEKKTVEEKVDKLIKETEAFLEAYERTKETIEHKRSKRRAQHWNHNKHKQKTQALINNNDSSLECKIEKDGTVNCSQVIYNDLKAWHTNRLSLEDQIRQLKTKLEDLKEIKRHLKNSKPAQVEVQTINPSYIINRVKNITNIHNNSTNKTPLRKSRIQRIKPKQRKPDLFEKKLKQTNEYSIPTVNTNIKDDILQKQIKSEVTSVVAITQSDLNETVSVNNNATQLLEELPKPQVTTIITNNNNYDEELVEGKSTSQTVIRNNEYTTEFTTVMESSSAVNPISTLPISEAIKTTTPTNLYTTAKFFISEADRILSLHQNHSQNTAFHHSTTESSYFPLRQKSVPSTASNLGPTRFDASEYEKLNPNRGTPNNVDIFSKPTDIFQRRLHPLFIENEDKHVCYCEENR